MSWPIPPSAQWNTGIAMSSNMNMGYTPEQWALMQQQNWQQWSQWQQQYAQWQSQYGEKYAEQMHAIGMVPPLPPMSCAPPPAPPPPDQPPPPPHQNDQPLYGYQKPPPPPVPVPVPVPAPAPAPPSVSAPTAAPPTVPAQLLLPLPPPAPAPTPTQVLSKPDYTNKAKTSSNPQNWSYATDICNDISQNTESLEQLSEEERFFDIQFQKWEKQIEKWKEENANHPDKKAYSEYEQKFEACRAQLLERRQQMKQKRARLTSSTTQVPNSAVAGNTMSSAIPAVQTVNRNYSPTNPQSQKFNSNQSGNGSNQKFSHYPYYNASQPSYSNENKLDQQYRNDSYQSVEPYSCGNMDKSNFLPTKEALKGIPGLDLVPEVEKMSGHNKQQDVIDITQDKFIEKQSSNLKGPDYSTISQGINNILGDEKIMNILSMVRGQQSFDSADASRQSSNVHIIINDKQQLSTPPPSMRQNIPYNPHNTMAFPRQDLEHSVQRPSYDQSQKNILMDQHYINYSHNSDQNPTSKNISHMEQPIQNQSIQNSFENLPRDNHERRAIADQTMCPAPGQPVRSKWIEDPLFTPSVIVDYEHKPLRLKARDFIEPVHVFDYNHKSKETDYRKKDFEKEVDELFFRQPRKKELDDDGFTSEKFHRDLHYRDYEKKPRDYIKEDYRQRVPLREEYVERRRYEDKYDDRKKDDSDKYRRREDIYRDRQKDWEKGRDRDEYNRDRYRDYRKDDNRNRSRSKEKENRKRDHSKESDSDRGIDTLKKAKASNKNDITQAKHIVMIDDILESPGREMRPDKIVIILRGLPGSGKSYLAKLIRDKEAEHGGTVRIMSLDDYFMQEGEIEVNDPVTGKVVKKPSLKYEYDPEMEESYLNSLKRAFKRSLTDGYFTFLIFDAVNEQLKSYADVWNFARQSGFQVYICTMEADVATCHKRNIHNRSLDEIEVIKARFFSTPAHHIQLDPTTLLQSAAITEVQMEDADDGVTMEDTVETEVENHFTSKWEKMDDAAQLARLDGTSKPLRPSQLSMEDYLQIDDWKPNVAKPGKKTVRWADIEERRQQEKMRAIGFVVGQTDWNRMTDPTMGSSALTQTKYIERVRRM